MHPGSATDLIITETIGQRESQHNLYPYQFKTAMKRLCLTLIDYVLSEMQIKCVNDVNRTYSGIIVSHIARL